LQVGQRKRREVQGQISRKVGREINSFRDSKKRDIPRHLICKKFSQGSTLTPTPQIQFLFSTVTHITSHRLGQGQVWEQEQEQAEDSRGAGEQKNGRTVRVEQGSTGSGEQLEKAREGNRRKARQRPRLFLKRIRKKSTEGKLQEKLPSSCEPIVVQSSRLVERGSFRENSWFVHKLLGLTRERRTTVELLSSWSLGRTYLSILVHPCLLSTK